MSDDTVQSAERPRPPLTVAEIVNYKPPISLQNWKLVQDTAGGYSFRTTIGDIDYIGIPRKWAGRTLTPGGNAMGTLTAYNAMNGVTGVDTQAAGTMATNDPGIDRSLVPKDVAPTVAVDPTPINLHPAIIPGAISLLLALLFVGYVAFRAGRSHHGHA